MNYYNSTDTCDKINEDGNRCGKSFHGKAYKVHDKNGKFTGKWMCRSCYYKEGYYIKKNINANLRNSIRNHRTGNLNPKSESAKGDLFQKLSCEWLGIEDLNIRHDNYNWPIDHSKHSVYGIVQTRGRLMSVLNRYETTKKEKKFTEGWFFSGLEREWNKEFDNLICYCASKDQKLIERIYVFPWDEVLRRKIISIVKSYNYGWYKDYMVNDEETLKKVNEIWSRMTIR